MALRLKEVVFRVRCREIGCPFVSDFSVKENIMGATQEDVDSEALKIARDQAMTKHDAIYGRRHTMLNPETHKVAGTYETLGPVSPAAKTAPMGRAEPLKARRFDRGERIVTKGEHATTVCEVIRGSATSEARPGIVYRPGSTFGAAALFEHKKRMASIVAAEDDTLIGFYDMRDLSKTDPNKARELYNEAMEDIFHVLAYLEKKIAKLKAGAAKKPTKTPARKAPGKPLRRSAKKPARKSEKKSEKKSTKRKSRSNSKSLSS